jgi:hypothetical protein
MRSSFGVVCAGHFGEQHNNQGRHLEKGPEKECAPDNKEKQHEQVRKEERRMQINHAWEVRKCTNLTHLGLVG